MAGRLHVGDYEDDIPQRRGRREGYHDEFDEREDEPEFEDKPEERPPRRKVTTRKHKARHVEDDEEEEEEEESEDRYGKQLILRKSKKATKSSGKEIVRRKKQETSEEEDSSEEEKKVKKKAKKKSKARKSEVISKAAWEPVPRNETDEEFVQLVSRELGHHPNKIMEGVEDDLILRHTESGEYNIDGFFEEGILSARDKKKWKQCVNKLMANKNRSAILFSSAKVQAAGPGYGSSYGPARRRTERTLLYMPAPARGHRHFNPNCSYCRSCGEGCDYLFQEYGY